MSLLIDIKFDSPLVHSHDVVLRRAIFTPKIFVIGVNIIIKIVRGYNFLNYLKKIRDQAVTKEFLRDQIIGLFTLLNFLRNNFRPKKSRNMLKFLG